MVDFSTGMSWVSVHKISRDRVDVLVFYVLLFEVVCLA
jgi:hypothetical protein